MHTGQIVIARLLEKKLATDEQIEGCTEEDIEMVMKAQNVTTLPQLYKDFLLAAGRNAGKLWFNGAFKINSLSKLKKSANKLLREDGNPISLPSDAFVFYMQEGMLFYYFLSSDPHDDPEIFEYLEVECSHGKLDYPLSEFLTNVY